MWIIFPVLCMVSLTASEIVGKQAIDADKLSPLKLRILFLTISFIASILVYALGLGESGLAPWTLVIKYPLILCLVLFLDFTEILYLFSMRYVGMSIMEAISSLEGVAIFIGLFLINSFTGKLATIKDMLVPVRFILICVILLFTILLPNIEIITKRKALISSNQLIERRTIAIGIIISVIAVISSSGDSLLNDTILYSGDVGNIDYIMTVYFMSIIPLLIFGIILYKKEKHVKLIYKNILRHSILYVIFTFIQTITGVIAASIDAVRSEILYLTYPVIAILAAKIILKEKFTWKQNVCIWIITLAAIAFCSIDYLI